MSVAHAISSPADRLSATFAALSDPTRRAILARLALADMTVSELAEPFAISLAAISKHLKVLEQAGLVRRGRKAQWRPCRLDAQAMQPAVEWLGQFALLWGTRLDQLEDYLTKLTARGGKRGGRQ